MIPKLNKNSSVLEDWINQEITIGYINEKYHLKIENNTGRQKWSDYVLSKLKLNGFNIDSNA